METLKFSALKNQHKNVASHNIDRPKMMYVMGRLSALTLSGKENEPNLKRLSLSIKIDRMEAATRKARFVIGILILMSITS